MAQSKLAYGVVHSKAIYPLRLARYKALAEDVAAWVRAHPGPRPLRLLDLGVGTGRTLRFIEAEGVAGELRFHGFDLSPRRLAMSGERKEWLLCQGTLTAPLPFATGSVDLCICEQVIEHLDETDSVLSEIARVMRPGGLLVLGVPTFPAAVVPWHKRFTRLRRRLLPEGHFHFQTFSADSAEAMVRDAGFSVRNVRGFRWISGGFLRPLENQAWWYRANRRFGARHPGLCTEVQVLATRDASAEPGDS